ncbi:hypothetical protein [Streptodolium elevatio]|uniref:Uncharacterized protein n=1 Tax=Streptodolium elevatio TaxID=3157996 RepID=A0ABV3DS42_9ACTN
MRDALRSYLQIASGLTEMTVQKVTEAAKQLVEKSGVDLDHVPAQVAQQAQAVPQYVQQVADDLFATGKANRDLLVGVVRSEVDKAMGRLRPWTDDLRRVEDDLARAERRITDLEHRLAVVSAPPRATRAQAVPVADDERADEERVPVRKPARAAAAAPAPPSVPEEDAPFARRAVTPAKAAKRAAAKRAPAKTTPAKTTPAKTAPAKTTPAKTAPDRTAPAKSTASKSTAAKATSGKTAADKPAAGKKAPAKAPAKKTAPAKPAAVPKPAAPPKPPTDQDGSPQ